MCVGSVDDLNQHRTHSMDRTSCVASNGNQMDGWERCEIGPMSRAGSRVKGAWREVPAVKSDPVEERGVPGGRDIDGRSVSGLAAAVDRSTLGV